VWVILRRWFECSPTAYEAVRDCRKFDTAVGCSPLSHSTCWNVVNGLTA
jgi:hypothetical protein